MKAIWKFPFKCGTEAMRFHRMPPGKVIHVEKQHDQICMWVEVDKSIEHFPYRTFRVFGTGWDIIDGYEHRGTWLDGAYVWHLYEFEYIE